MSIDFAELIDNWFLVIYHKSTMTTLAKSRRGAHFTPEHQRKAQACRSYESLAQAGRKGYEALVMRHGIEIVQQNAAKWRRKHPNRYERQVMEWLEDHGINYQRDVMIENVRYCDFVLTYRVCDATAEQMAEVERLSAQLAAIDHRLNELAFELADNSEPMTQTRLRELVNNESVVVSMLISKTTVLK